MDATTMKPGKMTYVEADLGDIVDVRTPNGTVSLVIMETGQVSIRSLFKGAGQGRVPGFTLYATEVTALFTPNPEPLPS